MNNEPIKGRLLCVDDEEGVRQALARRLGRAGYHVATAASGEEGLAYLEQEIPDVIISDQRMPGMCGLDFLRQVRQRAPEVVCLLLTAYADLNLALEAINSGVVARFLAKPWDDVVLEQVVAEALQEREDARRRAALWAEVRTRNEELQRLNADLRQQMDATSAQLVWLEQEMGRARRMASVGEMAVEITHRIKSRLTAVHCVLDIIRDEAPNGSIRQWCEVGLEGSRRVVELTRELIDYVLDMSVDYHFQPIELNDHLRKVFETLRPHVQERGLRLEYDLAEPVVLPVEPARLGQALLHLGFNALEATSEGELRVATERSNGQVLIHVSDTGPGLPEKIQDHLFLPFVTEGKDHGTGLGLATARHVVERHGGAITFRTTPGQGTTFTIALPVT